MASRTHNSFILKVVLLSFLFISCSEKHTNIVYYDNSLIKYLHNNKDSILNGQRVWFYKNGNIKQVVNFKNGLADGNAFYFYESGALKNHSYWKNDHLSGYSTDYKDDSIGIIERVGFYENGKLIEVKKAIN